MAKKKIQTKGGAEKTAGPLTQTVKALAGQVKKLEERVSAMERQFLEEKPHTDFGPEDTQP